MTEIKHSATWRDLHDLSPQLFPSVVELAQDSGHIGEILRRLPAKAIGDADRCPDPWERLRANRLIRESEGPFVELFDACASVRPAILRLARVAWGGASVSGDRGGEVRAKSPEQGVDQGMKRGFRMLWEAGGLDLREQIKEESEDVQTAFAYEADRVQRQLTKGSGRQSAQPGKWDSNYRLYRQFQRCPVHWLMTVGWLRLGQAQPGLCFFSDNAILGLFELLNWSGFRLNPEKLNHVLIRKWQDRLGLRKASIRHPLFTNVYREPKVGNIVIQEADNYFGESYIKRTTFRCCQGRCGCR